MGYLPSFKTYCPKCRKLSFHDNRGIDMPRCPECGRHVGCGAENDNLGKFKSCLCGCTAENLASRSHVK